MAQEQKHTALLKTHYHYPWALVFYGQGKIGNTRPTNLCFITDTVVKDGVITHYKIRRQINTYDNRHRVVKDFAKSICIVPKEQIAYFFTKKRFQQPPDAFYIERARKAVKAAIAKAMGGQDA
jgi:hypothetical protein